MTFINLLSSIRLWQLRWVDHPTAGNAKSTEARSNGLKCGQADNQNDVFVAYHVGGFITVREGDYNIVCVEVGSWDGGYNLELSVCELPDDITVIYISSSSSEDCKGCGNYVRHVFSLVPGSLAAISLLIVLLFQASKLTGKQHGKFHWRCHVSCA